MAGFRRRNRKGYDGTEITTYRVGEVLPRVLSNVSAIRHIRSDLILASWAELVGPRIAAVARADSFQNGKLRVRVTSATMLSHLAQFEKERLLNELQKRFPNAGVREINFRIG